MISGTKGKVTESCHGIEVQSICQPNHPLLLCESRRELLPAAGVNTVHGIRVYATQSNLTQNKHKAIPCIMFYMLEESGCFIFSFTAEKVQ